jgi:hypothetical protein
MASTRLQRKRNCFPSAHLSDSEDDDLLSNSEDNDLLSNSEDDDLLSLERIIARAWKATKKPAIDLTGDDANHDVVISWPRKPPGRLGITRS